ncbi:Pentatricopeptide repeat-containing protein, partial [Mucuna pruriens]
MSLLRIQSCFLNQTLSFSYSPSLPFKHCSSTLAVGHAQSPCLRRLSVTCSISKVHSYGTVDYERRPIVRWNDVYRKISMNPDPDAGSADVLNKWENQGKTLTKWELSRIIKELRKYKRYHRALQGGRRTREDRQFIKKKRFPEEGRYKTCVAAQFNVAAIAVERSGRYSGKSWRNGHYFPYEGENVLSSPTTFFNDALSFFFSGDHQL